MIRLQPVVNTDRPVRLLCIGAHSDDLEIGCGGTILSWLKSIPAVDVTWVVLSAHANRTVEARKSANALLRGAGRVRTVFGTFRDGYLPAQYSEAKTFFEELKQFFEIAAIVKSTLKESLPHFASSSDRLPSLSLRNETSALIPALVTAAIERYSVLPRSAAGLAVAVEEAIFA